MNRMTKDARKKNLLWPDGDAPCIWMEAGIIDYKLCDRNFDCDNCPFDAIIRSGKDLSYKEELTQSERPSTDLQSKRGNRGRAPQSLAEILQFPEVHSKKDGYYGFSYWYVVPKSSKTAILGLNWLAVKLLPTIKDVILPSPNAHIKRGKTLCWFVLNEGTLCLLSPVSGVVQQVNENAAGQLENKNDPEGAWLVEVEAENATKVLNGMLKAHEADAFLQVQRLNTLDMLSSYIGGYQPDLGPTLQDGGVHVDDLEEMIGAKKYFEFLIKVFKSNCSRIGQRL